MTDVVLTKQRIEPRKVDRPREWTEDIKGREDEALATLENEGMHLEAAFVEDTDDGAFLVYVMKADDVDAVFSAFESSAYDIDREHAEVLADVLESPDRVGDYELLYWLSNPERP